MKTEINAVNSNIALKL